MKKSNWHGGKGSTPRTDTNSKQYQDNWEKIFGKTKGCPVKEYVEDVKKSKLDNVEFPQRKNINTRGK